MERRLVGTFLAALFTLASLVLPGPSWSQCTGAGTVTTNLSLCKPTCGSTDWCTDGHNALTTLDARFSTSGHNHTGSAGQGPLVTTASFGSTNAATVGHALTVGAAGLVTYVDPTTLGSGSVPTSRTITMGNGLQIDGGASANLSANRTISFDYGLTGITTALGADECVFSTNAGGLLCEGTIDNSGQSALVFEEGADVLITVPGVNGRICLGGQACRKGFGTDNLVIGEGTTSPAAGQDEMVIIGEEATVADDCPTVVIGSEATSTCVSAATSQAILIGRQAADAGIAAGCLAIGREATCAAADPVAPGIGQIVLGSSAYPLSVLHLGNGVFNTSPGTSAIMATSGNGANVNGGALIVAGGASTGTGDGGIISFATTASAGAGSTVNTPAQRWAIDSDGHLYAPTSNAVDIGVATSSGSTLVRAPRNVYIGTAIQLLSTATGITAEGVTDDAFETTLAFTDPTTPDKVITFPDLTGTVCLSTGCGASASGFFTSGTVGAAQGGTGLDTSGSNGTAHVLAGNWGFFFERDSVPQSMATVEVDATQCVKSVRTVNSGPKIPVVTCGDNAAGIVFFVFTMPATYQAGTGIEVQLLSQNENATPSGVLAFDVSCMCTGGTIGSAAWSAGTACDTTYATQFREADCNTAVFAPGGTCQGDGETVFCRAVVDATATTTAQTADTFVHGARLVFQKDAATE